MKFLVFTRPIEGIEKKLPRPREFEAQIGWIREQLDSGRIDCAYHGENHAVAIVNAESREDLEQFYGTMPLVELVDRKVEALGSLFDQMQGVLESLSQISSAQELSERHEGKLPLRNGAIRNRPTGWADWTLPLPYVQEVQRRRLHLDRLGQSRSFQMAKR
jgi:hypothetical protein